MCDVVVAMPDVTRSGRVVFGKNSDRPSGECQVLFWDPGGEHPAGEQAECSYVAVPRGELTLATLGLRPYWCWGYETGVNEAGVAGGNAAVFSSSLRGTEARVPGLTGMDLLRLSLERGRSAGECVSAATSLLETYGQWGSAVQGKGHEEGSYDNSFLFADAAEAWVLETAGRSWAAERITSGVRTISNEFTIREEFDLASRDVDAMRGGGAFDFAYAFEDHEHYPRQVSHIRAMRTRTLLAGAKGAIATSTVMRVLRDHYEDSFLEGPSFNRYLPDFLTVCMHDSPAGFTWGDTATSLVVELDASLAEPIWVGYLPPCSSAYLPVFFAEALPSALTSAGNPPLRVARPERAPSDPFNRESLWWRLHRLVKAVARSPRRYAELRAAFDPLEGRWTERFSDAAAGESPHPRDRAGSLEARSKELLAAIESMEVRWGIGT